MARQSPGARTRPDRRRAGQRRGAGRALAGVAYLHNATSREAVAPLYDMPADRHGRLFTGADRGDFLDFLRSRLDGSVHGAPYADVLLGSKAAPSKQLLAVRCSNA